ncbi:MAG: bifunctional UDP-3-O-[3-hydroxymyristoyl] N-acetylglucosamine deacetylase/3-hydroxyacyl-ACP dehydratase [Verrucomicrobiae bacterium]|nr:bifunctional UDP-3-O-[3-hydroxymyristoyl] N-acetylglucosamine deacetylase/3-hydroxyacyl-ACP dehydratase [Verrucomicrobiae bacterium]
MSSQHTLNRAVELAGVGLHSGNRVHMSILPAPPDTGLRFRRVDLDGKPEVEARVENVTDTTRSTTLARGNIKIHTVEHVLAALAGCGVDNAIIELDANEPPIADGSAREFCRLIHAAGLTAQDARRQPWSVTEPISLEQGDTVMTLLPGEGFRISCTSADSKGRFTQFFSTEITPKTFERELAHARTFCFYEEIAYLIQNGLIRGGSLENAVVIREDAVLTTEPLRYPEEFVRHKMLDIVGDLALVGRPVQGHLIAVRPGHTANCELARRLVAQMQKPLRQAQTFLPPPTPAPEMPTPTPLSPPPAPVEGALDVEGIMRWLPHRYPFLMVDRVLRIEGNRIVALKNVSIGEPYFAGHFPGQPIMPGVLQLEAIAQVAGLLMLMRAEERGFQVAYFMSAEKVKWRKPVRPGDTLLIEVELTKTRGRIGRATGVCKVGEEMVSEAEVTFMVQ